MDFGYNRAVTEPKSFGVDGEGARSLAPKHVMRDNDTKFTVQFDAALALRIVELG